MRNKMVKSVLSMTLAASMVVTSAVPSLGAQTDPNASAEREARNMEIARQVAEQGMVLLDNQGGALPIAKSGSVALYGVGTYGTVKGGTGSGSTNPKDGSKWDVLTAFKDAGYNVVNEGFLNEVIERYKESGSTGGGMRGAAPIFDEGAYAEADIEAAAADTQTAIYVLARNSGEFADRGLKKGDYYLYDSEAANLAMLGEKFENVIVVMNVGGIIDTNFYHGLSEEKQATEAYKDSKTGQVTYGEEVSLEKIEGLDSLFLMSQGGLEGGNALVKVLNGTVNPSGKLTDTWAINYKDYPSSYQFSYLDDSITFEEFYRDDIYVGYRYFDTFGITPAYEFGYGESYTDFEVKVDSVAATEKEVTVKATVTNTGSADGKEVVEVYFSAPEGAVDKPYQELAGYQKVAVAAGASEQVTVTFDTTDMSSYDEAKEAYVMEDGDYIIRVGNSSRNTVEAATLTLDEDVTVEYAANQLGLTKDGMQSGNYEDGAVLHLTNNNDRNNPQYGTDPIEDMLDENADGYGTGITPTDDGLSVAATAAASLKKSNFAEPVTHEYTEGVINTYVSSDKSKDSAKYAEGKTSTDAEKLVNVDAVENPTLVDVKLGYATMEQLVADMSNVELADLVEGGTYAGQPGNDETGAVIGNSAQSVPGAAGETTKNLYTTRFIPNIVLADGPAGLRVSNKYVEYTAVGADAAYDANATYYTSSGGNRPTYTKVEIADADAFKTMLSEGTALFTGITYYQNCTAIPIGTLIAQTWDPEIIEKAGQVIGEEMLEYGVTSWLAPGMNIHRNPLCGRNFEYFSEDPLIVGNTATAETKGVQIDENGNYRGLGVTLKHYAFNQQEESRNGSNSVMSERAAREIYLKGFEMAVKNASPDYIMTSYNMINGYPTFHSYALNMEMLRNEWGFNGFVMTDWGATNTVFGKHATYNEGGGVNNNITRRDSRGWLMYSGNDCEMSGNNVPNMLAALEDGSVMRLGDLQRSAINMLNVIMRSAVFDKLFNTLIENHVPTATKYFQQQLAEAEKKVEELQKAGEEAAAELKKAQEAVEALKKQLENLLKGDRSEMEKKNAEISKRAAEEGIVLLENENNALPLAKDSKVAVFGTANYGSIKGGTGSGDVYNKYTVTIYDGLQSAYKFSNQAWWENYIKTFEEKKAQALSEKQSNDYAIFVRGGFGGADSVLAIDQPLTADDMNSAKANGVNTAIYTISRTSGEGADRAIEKGEYYLSDVERANIELMNKNFDKTIVLLNVGGIVDTKFFKEINGLDSLVLVSQAGMEGGNAVASILTGAVTPSGKLSDTWAVDYEDYPASAIIGDHDGDTIQENYEEGIYVGYRYFDSFNVTPAYEFGYGKSYTEFDITPVSVKADANNVTVTVKVKNTGDTYSGKEVAEVYFSAPDGAIEKPYQELAGFAKTDVLAPGESQNLTVTYKTTEMSSYSEDKAAYIMEDGNYVIRVGNSSRNTKAAAVLTLAKDVITEQLSNQLVVDTKFDELSAAKATSYSYKGEAAEIAAAKKIALAPAAFETENNASSIDEDAVTTYLTAEAAADYTPAKNEKVEVVDDVKGSTLKDVYDGKISMESFLASLTNTQLANIVNGTRGADMSDATEWGSDANSVQGAAGETTGNYGGTLGIPNTVEADGPAGVRVTEEKYNATAFPIGTLLAQTWNIDMLTEVGLAIGEEMNAFGVTLWLAPGMNIHRDPMNGRNFEYYSEDPALTGLVGSCITAGVQSNPGVGVTIKHYITNNQETSRNQANTSVSERALREIYLKGFEMVVKSTQPMAIMSSYNKVNGTYACENFDLLESIPRGEWGFDGMVMTDWGAGGRASVSGMMHSGNDLVMPGSTQTRIVNALAGNPSHDLDKGKTLILGDVQKCAGRVLTMISRSLQFGRMYSDVDVKAHTSTYNNLTTYLASNKDKIVTKEEADTKAEIDKVKQDAENAKKEAEELKAQLGSSNALVKEALAKAEAAQKELEKLQFTLKQVSLKKVSGKKKAVKATWKKVAGADGYEVSYATNSSFKKAKKKSVTSASLNIKKLKANKKYYVRVRAYKTIGGVKVYTKYSKKLSAKTKK